MGRSKQDMPALGTTHDVPRGAALTRFQYYLSLPDALKVALHNQAAHLAELAESFSRDILNLAVLAGRLLRFEGITPDLGRSHDLVNVVVDTEAYLVMLQTACDIMADVVATLGAKRSQAPSESLHALTEWARRHPDRLAERFQALVRAELPWFSEINAARTHLVHRGAKVFVYTDRVAFRGGVEGLRGDGYLINSLQRLTRSVLEFSESLARAVRLDEHAEREMMPVIDGVYVPALHHLLSRYSRPSSSDSLKLRARCLQACGGYAEAALIGYPDGYWWTLVVGISEAIRSGPSAATIPLGVSGDVYNCRFVFVTDEGPCGLVACDKIIDSIKWLEGARESLEEFSMTHGLKRVVLAGQRPLESVSAVPGTNIPIVIRAEPLNAAGEIARAFLS
jgi:hypothetical protein